MNQPVKTRPSQPGSSRPRNWLVGVILTLAFVGFLAFRPPCNCGPRKNSESDSTLPVAGSNESAARKTGRTTVLYLHGSIRCPQCIEIEEIAKETVHTYFPDKLAAGTLTWQSIDYDLPENKNYEEIFKPPYPSLFLAAVSVDGQFVRHQMLSKCWDLIRDDPDAMEAYVHQEIRRFANENTLE